VTTTADEPLAPARSVPAASATPTLTLIPRLMIPRRS